MVREDSTKPGNMAEAKITDMRHEITIHNLNDLDRAAKEFLSEIGDHKLIAFYAPMGAGKTTFTTALCRRLGVKEDAVASAKSVKLSTSASLIMWTVGTFALWNGPRTLRRSSLKRLLRSASRSIPMSPGLSAGKTRVLPDV